MDLELAKRLSQPADTKIILCVMDGLGGLARAQTLRSELEAASVPNLDRLATRSEVGLTTPVGPGITPGSGPGHLALFGYDPYQFDIGRGVLEATGIDFELGPDDVAARGNFCTLGPNGAITDRRAGRVATEVSAGLVERLRAIKLDGVETFVEPVRDHRFVLVLRGAGLGDEVSTTDPQREGVAPLPATGTGDQSQRTAELVNDFVRQAHAILADQPAANGLTLRGFAKYPSIPAFPETWGVRAAALAVYPMYRGLAKIAGMTPLACPAGMPEQLRVIRERWDDFDYFFVHYKKTDAAGEDGNFEAKCHALQEFDAFLPELLALNADVLMIAGDHSTPALMAAHSWHPVPFLLYSQFCREGNAANFNEQECLKGTLGVFPAVDVMPLAMAHALRFQKYGA
ncbi:MAG TPA: 2,3-bisphosphoglycerate-independent phosphoglycerate mutase [Tepidiformaceae bacterium]|nr:2,3-bisphosphoglycerate-independent phosphoglycerate mutase [Tepidiformaceae bacterium]